MTGDPDGASPRGLADRLRALDAVDPVRVTGRLRSAVGLAVRATIPGVRTGELVLVDRRGAPPLLAEVAGFRDDETLLVPLGEATGLAPDDPVTPTGAPLRIPASDALLGRVLDGLGRPIDGGPPLEGPLRDVDGAPPDPLTRPRPVRALPVGVRALDAAVTLAEGQRLGLFAGAGVGKSTLLAQIARGADADVFVACLVGERGREVGEFLEDALGPEGRRRGVVVCATSDAPARVRMRAVSVATAVAEHFRDRGRRVLLLVDSLTRFARAAREVGLAVGEPPTRRGYPPSVFAALPRLVERAGIGPTGSITALYTVLVEGGDLDEPVADEARGLLDGHVVLSRDLAERGRFPAVDVPASLSRLMGRVTSDAHRELAAELRELLAVHEANRDLVAMGAYERGADARLDAALDRLGAIEAFLRQPSDAAIPLADTLAALSRALGRSAPGPDAALSPAQPRPHRGATP